jgi:hypothetical protein
MANTRTIEIDFAIHKAIENERRDFHESDSSVLRRLLKLPEAPRVTGGNGVDAASGTAWVRQGVRLVHGTRVRMHYRGEEHLGAIENGEWVIEGQRFSSPSAAAGGVAVTKKGTQPSLDGWTYWQVKRPGDTDWVSLRELRPSK